MFLKKIHSHSQGIVVKIFLGILGASFGLWGIADVVQKYVTNRPIAKVGKFDISHEELSHMLSQETNRIQQMYNGKLDPAVLKKLQLHKIVLERLINQKALTQLFGNLHFAASDELVGEVIRSQPTFKKDGVYDGALLREVLRSNRISETKFLEQMREDIYKEQMAGTLAAAISLPKIAVDLITDALTTKHSYAAITIPFKAMHIEKHATDEDLKLLFEQKKETYRIPEYRKAQVVVFDQNILAKNIKPTEEEVKERYENSLADFTQVERRMVRRVTYPNHVTAVAALERLKKGRPMSAVVRDVPGGTYDDMGLLEKENLSENVRTAVFALESGKHSDPIENGPYYSIYEVTRIEPAATQSFATVRAKVEEDVRAQKYPDFFQDLRNSFDDDLASGLKLSDVAAKHGLKVMSLSEFNKNGATHDGQDTLAGLSDEIKTAVLEQAFLLEENKDSLITDVSATQAFVVHVEKVIPSIIPEFTAVKDAVKKDWEHSRKRESAFKLAEKLTKDSKGLHEIKEYAKEHGYPISETHTIRRVDLELKEFKETKAGKFISSFTPELLQKLFTITPGKTVYDELPNDNVVILMLQKSEPDTMDKAMIEKIKMNVQKISHQDVLPILTQVARERIDVALDEKMLALITHGLNDGD